MGGSSKGRSSGGGSTSKKKKRQSQSGGQPSSGGHGGIHREEQKPDEPHVGPSYRGEKGFLVKCDNCSYANPGRYCTGVQNCSSCKSFKEVCHFSKDRRFGPRPSDLEFKVCMDPQATVRAETPSWLECVCGSDGTPGSCVCTHISG